MAIGNQFRQTPLSGYRGTDHFLLKLIIRAKFTPKLGLARTGKVLVNASPCLNLSSCEQDLRGKKWVQKFPCKYFIFLKSSQLNFYIQLSYPIYCSPFFHRKSMSANFTRVLMRVSEF